MEGIKKNWPECLVFLVILFLIWKTFEQSVLEHHFIIPTVNYFAPGILLGNLIYYSRKGLKWPKLVLFWLFVIGDFCSFLAIFYSPSLAKITIGFIAGPIIVAVLVPIFTYLLYSYQKINELFKD
ncbi:MAG: hypothetical protein H6912_01915 [Kordiimonadaceae bacterium]|nr:hypothetical protein [Kordiimonadaceae bacterium]